MTQKIDVVNARADERAKFQILSDAIDALPVDIPPPSIRNFVATPSTLGYPGGPVMLDALVQNATQVLLNGVVISGFPIQVTVTLGPGGGTQQFDVTAKGPGGADATATLLVTVLHENAPVITSFTATPNTLPAAGGQVQLAWTATDAATFMLDGAVATSPVTKLVSVDHNFTLIARGVTYPDVPDATAGALVDVIEDTQAQWNWTLLGAAGGPVTTQGWWMGTCIAGGSNFLSAGGVPSNWVFDPATGQWALKNSNATLFYKAGVGASENYGMCYDYDHNLVYKGIGSPNVFTAKLTTNKVTANATAPHFVLDPAAGFSWRDQRFAPGELFSIAGYTAPATGNNQAVLKVAAVDALNLSVVKSDGTAATIVAKAAGDTVTFAGDSNTSPFYGEATYDPTADEWTGSYPASTATYRPGDAASAAHWTQAGMGKIVSWSDGVLAYWNNATFGFGAFSIGIGQLRKRDLVTGVITTLTTNLPPWTLPSRTPHLRGGIDHRSGVAWTLADNCEFYQRDTNAPLNTPWSHINTTGDKPITSPPGDGSVGTDWGIVAQLHEDKNCIIAWCGKNAGVGTINMTTYQRTWVLDLATLVWTQLAPVAKPTPTEAVACNLLYNRDRKSIQLLVCSKITGGGKTEVWELNFR